MNGHHETGTLALPLQRFFTEHLINQKSVSPATVASYRDSFRLFLRYLEHAQRRSPAAMDLSDFTAPNVLAFLDHLEQERHNKARSRNARLSAMRAFAAYLLAFDAVTRTPPVQRILKPCSKHPTPPVGLVVATVYSSNSCIIQGPEFRRSSISVSPMWPKTDVKPSASREKVASSACCH
jgi:site-specific recombinase XerD